MFDTSARYSLPGLDIVVQGYDVVFFTEGHSNPSRLLTLVASITPTLQQDAGTRVSYFAGYDFALDVPPNRNHMGDKRLAQVCKLVLSDASQDYLRRVVAANYSTTDVTWEDVLDGWAQVLIKEYKTGDYNVCESQ